jgi:hypothetical protein
MGSPIVTQHTAACATAGCRTGSACMPTRLERAGPPAGYGWWLDILGASPSSLMCGVHVILVQGRGLLYCRCKMARLLSAGITASSYLGCCMLAWTRHRQQHVVHGVWRSSLCMHELRVSPYNTTDSIGFHTRGLLAVVKDPRAQARRRAGITAE